MKKYDIVIIGAGPIGLACGIEAAKNNLSYVIIDKGTLVNSIYNYPDNMTFFSTSDRLEIGGIPFISYNVKPTRPEALEYYRRVTSSLNLNVNLYETVSELKKKEGAFRIETVKDDYEASSVVLATGFYDIPYLLHVPGEDLPKVKHYYSDPHPYFRKKVLVVGASNSSVDVALECFRSGAEEVTMVVRGNEIGYNVKYWVRPDIENRIKEGTIKSHFQSQITEIRENEVDINTPDGPITLENDFVLAMTGYQPDFTFLKKVGIQIGTDEHHTPIHNPTTMETNVGNLFLAGVICGGLKTNKWFIENSRVHAEMIIEEIVKKRKLTAHLER